MTPYCSNKQENEDQEYQCAILDTKREKWFQKWYQISCSINKIQYIIDGQIIRMQVIRIKKNREKLRDYLIKPQIFTNLNQIQYLQWTGNYGKNNNKVGNGVHFGEVKNYRKLQILKVLYFEGYLERNNKKLLQVSIYQVLKYSQFQAFELGEYKNNKKSGKWITVFKNRQIGGGLYNEQGQKEGKWIELSEAFLNGSKATFSYIYKNGKIVGLQDIFFNNKIYGFGFYGEVGSYGVKLGNWVEISNRFKPSSQITYNGRYKYGSKAGRWDIEHKQKIMNGFSGGGIYDEGGDGTKNGIWTELDDKYNYSNQVIHNGYYKNDKKAGL
ncbi:unnamed protein product [Paramecium pentaurelia]|uniref:MORN repeat protein n=1 Tax=Paramecium pentaurelia TaxID=43138 RepID=A0A8S1YGW5_9CILI|nr:unnamed protein product [Paramecium pentaurelia]